MLSSLKNQDTSKVFTTLASIAASAILVRTIYEVRRHFFTSNNKSSPYFSRRKTIFIEEHKEDDLLNKEFQAVDTYLVNEVSSSVSRLKVRKDEDMKRLVTNLEINEEIVDIFKNVEERWRLIFKHEMSGQGRHAKYMKSYELTFNKKHEQMVLNSYLPYIMERGKAIREECKVIKLCPVDYASGVSEYTFNFDHPITFETLAVDSELKKAVLDDLNTFMNAEEYYRNSSKQWKRGYLIYGPPGTGKSSLTAAMANHLNYDIYDLDVSEFDSNPDHLERWLIPGLPSRPVVVVEDIDSTIKQQNQGEKKVKVSDILKQLRLCAGDGQIVVFTTNHIDMLDPELLTPDLMNMHIHMPYCTISAFNQIAFNHFNISHHILFEEIEGLLKNVEVTLAEISGELLKSSDAEVSLQGLIKFLHNKIAEYDKFKA